MEEKEKDKEGTHGKLALSTGGVFERIAELAAAIKAVGEKFHLVNPGGAVGDKLPLLHSVGMSFVFPEPGKETYAIAGSEGSKVALTKNALDKIAAAAGVRWNPHLCGQTDDGSNAHRVEYQAAGTVLQLDGTERMIHASKRIDLRAERGAPAESWGTDAQEINRIAQAAKPPRDPWPQILQARQHILSLAESKAKNRAIRSLGVRTAYEPKEIEKGFAILKLQFTGQSDDPEVAHEVAIMIARRALDSADRLYGGEGRRELAPVAAARKVHKIAPEPEEKDEEDENNGDQPDPAAEEPKAKSAEAKPAIDVPVKPAQDPELICGAQRADKSWPKKPCSEFTIDDLRKKIAAYEKKQPTWDPRWAAKNEAELNAMKAWLAFKEFDPSQPSLNMGGAGGKSDTVSF